MDVHRWRHSGRDEAKVTVGLGEQVTCTIANTDNTPQLKLVKTVINDNGGNRAAPTSGALSAAAATDNGRNFNNLGGSGSFQNVFGGVQSPLSENPNPGNGYSGRDQWSCDGGALDATKTKVTVPLGLTSPARSRTTSGRAPSSSRK